MIISSFVGGSSSPFSWSIMQQLSLHLLLLKWVVDDLDWKGMFRLTPSDPDFDWKEMCRLALKTLLSNNPPWQNDRTIM